MGEIMDSAAKLRSQSDWMGWKQHWRGSGSAVGALHARKTDETDVHRHLRCSWQNKNPELRSRFIIHQTVIPFEVLLWSSSWWCHVLTMVTLTFWWKTVLRIHHLSLTCVCVYWAIVTVCVKTGNTTKTKIWRKKTARIWQWLWSTGKWNAVGSWLVTGFSCVR